MTALGFQTGATGFHAVCPWNNNNNNGQAPKHETCGCDLKKQIWPTLNQHKIYIFHRKGDTSVIMLWHVNIQMCLLRCL